MARTIIVAFMLAGALVPRAEATNCTTPRVTVATLRGQIVYVARDGSAPAVALPMELSRWAASDLKIVVRDKTGAQGRFEFPPLAPGLYLLAIGEATEFGGVIVEVTRRSRNRWLQIEAGKLRDEVCSPTRASARPAE